MGNDLGVEFFLNVPILGIAFSNTLERTTHESWSRTAAQIRSQAQQAYGRNMRTAQRIRYVRNTLLAPIWYIAQTLPYPETYTRQLTPAVQWYVWSGTIFRVTLSTLQKPLIQGSCALVNMAVKCQTLLLRRMWLQIQKEGTETANWLQTWGLRGQHHNPPHITRIPVQLDYLRQYARDMAYIEPPNRTEATRTFKKRIYETLILMAAVGKTHPAMSIPQTTRRKMEPSMAKPT
jgi:hypothetical protein